MWEPGEDTVRIFVSKTFAKFARKARISDAKLCAAVQEAENGKIDADYGGGVIKQRIARQGAGKSGGYRTIILYRQGAKAFFVYGFAKKDRENIDAEEEHVFKEAAKVVFAFTDEELDRIVQLGAFKEVQCDDEEEVQE